MKIGMLVSNFLPRQGGAEYAVHHLTSRLIALGHQVSVLAGHDPASRWIRYPYPVFHSPKLPLIPLESQRYLHAYLVQRRERFDLIHAHIAWEAGFVGAKLKRTLGIPLVITCHGGDVQIVPEIDYGLCLDPEKAEKVRFALSSADAVTSVSNRMRRALADRGARTERIRDVGYGTELDKIQNLQTVDLRKQLGLSTEDFVVLGVGRNSRVKDIPTFLQGFRLAADREPRLKCILVGPDESVSKMTTELNLTDRVRVLGRIPAGYDPRRPNDVVFHTPYPELIAAYRAADVFVATSYIESFNTSALDAFACAKPVIITNTQGFMDLLREGINGYSIPPRNPHALAERILMMVNDRERCKQMGHQAMETARDYDWHRVARRYVTVYEEAIGCSSDSSTNS